MSSLRPGLFLLMLGMVALVIIGCSGGDDEEPTPNPTTPPEATSAPQPTATSKPSVPGDSGTTEDGTGTLEVRVTDAPDPSITAVYVTTSNIEVSIAGDEGGWETVIDEEITFELLALEGVEAVLGTAELPTGRYTQIRLDVPEVEIEQNGEIVIAEVPSDTIKLVGTFELESDETTFISLDFEVDKSLVERGRQGFLFKPVIKLEVGEPGEVGETPVELPGKPDDVPTGRPEPTTVAAPTATVVPATSTPVPPTATPEPTATPTPTPTPTPIPDATGAFFLHIAEPETEDVIVTSDTFEVVGRTSVDALVSVNDAFPDVDVEGVFRSTVTLDEGPNVVEVVASTSAGDEASIVLLIIYEPAG